MKIAAMKVCVMLYAWMSTKALCMRNWLREICVLLMHSMCLCVL